MEKITINRTDKTFEIGRTTVHSELTSKPMGQMCEFAVSELA
jgi:hypothetical protein